MFQGEAFAQEGCKQIVIAVNGLAAAIRVKSKKQVTPVNFVQQREGIFSACQKLTGINSNFREDRNVEQERAHLRPLHVEDFFGQKIKDQAMRMPEHVEKRLPLGATWKFVGNAGKQGDPCCPAFGLPLDYVQVGIDAVEVQHPRQENLDLGRCKRQLRQVQFGKLAARTQTRQGKRWLVAPGYHNEHLRRQVFQQIVEQRQRRTFCNPVQIVNDEEKRRLHRLQNIVDEQGDNLAGFSHVKRQILMSGSIIQRTERLNSAHQPTRKPSRIVIVLVNREPCSWH